MSEIRKKILIVDDEDGVRDSLNLLLKKHFDTKTAEDGNGALDLVGEFRPDVILLDVMMPRMDGLSTLKELRSRGFEMPVVMLTASNTVRTAVEAMKIGASDYLNKPFDVEELTELILRLVSEAGESNQIPEDVSEVTSNEGEKKEEDTRMIGDSEPMRELADKLSRIATKDTTVLITGESGTGKELLARQVHQLSSRQEGPFIPINCAAIPESLIESELFGHEKGAFTHAVEKRIGHFERANGGTLFLDEIGELSLSVQVKMLRFLQEQEFFRVGSSKPIRVDARVVAATNQNLEELISAGRFREDLYYRINVINLTLPPLRDRFEDIPLLVDYFVSKFKEVYGKSALVFSEAAKKLMVEYRWPGNVRELENVIESLLALCQSEEIGEDDLPRKIRVDSRIETLKSEVFTGDMNFEQAEQQFEREMISRALKKSGYVQTRAAELLGISRRILKYKMDKLGLTEELQTEKEDSPNEGL